MGAPGRARVGAAVAVAERDRPQLSPSGVFNINRVSILRILVNLVFLILLWFFKLLCLYNEISRYSDSLFSYFSVFGLKYTVYCQSFF